MKSNVGGVDSAVRLTLGVMLFIVAYFGGLSTAGTVGVYAFAAAVFISGLFNFCPLYLLFGVSTCEEPMKKRPSPR
jgi:hypothetical protein